jgi:hypothetical protein|nr:MAG TPA: hypothetical protein [Caudoviricetes sp.]
MDKKMYNDKVQDLYHLMKVAYCIAEELESDRKERELESEKTNSRLSLHYKIQREQMQDIKIKIESMIFSTMD